MATNTKYHFMLSLSLILNFLLFPFRSTTALDKITAIFVFGDSIVDPGNNNNLFLPGVKANHPPYGNDYPGRIPTGRFSNGKLVTDFLVSKLGLKESLPAYLDPNLTDQDLLTGCSFAISGSGLDDLTSTQFNVPPMMTQLSYFQEAMQRMEKRYGFIKAGQVVENAMFFVVTGSNDMLRNFYGFRFRRYYSLSEYHDMMLGKLEAVVRGLYKMGARNIGVTGLPPIGCLPIQMTIESMTPSLDLLQYKCINQQNVDAQSYNAEVRNLMLKIHQTLPGSRIKYMDLYDPVMDMITNLTTYGFERSDKGCCGTGLTEFGYMCNSLSPICPDPSKYLFWDAVHPTEKANSILADYYMQFVPNGTFY